MKYKKILRLLGVITVLSMLLAVIPATPALAAISLALSPTTGKVGDRINFTGSGYAPDLTGSYYIDVYMSDQSAALNSLINTAVTRYKKVSFSPVDEVGSIAGSFLLPTTLDAGVVGLATPLTVTGGATYYIYVTTRYSDPSLPSNIIAASATLTITATSGLNALSPTSGAPGASVTVSGSGFLPSYPVLINFDTTLVSSTTFTDTSGNFTSAVTVPSGATAGAHTISATVGSAVLTATFTVVASAALNALVPATGAPGTSVTVSGSNFAPSYPVIISFDATVVSSTTITTTTGTFSGTITVPANALAGAHKINVTVGTVVASADFTVTAAPTTTPPTTTPPTTTPPTTTPPATSKAVLSINQSGHNVGATIGVGGAGFTPGATATIKYDDTQVATVKVEANGTFISPFFKAVGMHGDHTVTASDGTNTAKTTFTMESTAPKVPPPLLPELGAKAKSPVTFSWTAVTDDSMPIAYRLQVSADKSFATSPLVDKTGLTTPGYTLTAAEEAQLSGTDTPYYWRVEAIDAASNESGWTGASIFYIPGPFKLPSWGIYAGAAAGALIFFLIGLWIGRRTAFYY